MVFFNLAHGSSGRDAQFASWSRVSCFFLANCSFKAASHSSRDTVFGVSPMLVDILTIGSFEGGAASLFRSFILGWEGNASPDPELREGLEVPLISARDCVFL